MKDDMPPALNVSEQDLRSHIETSNTANKSEIDEESNRIKGTFASDNIFKLPTRKKLRRIKPFKQRSNFCSNARKNRSLASKKRHREIWQES